MGTATGIPDSSNPGVGSFAYGPYPARVLLTPGSFDPTKATVNAAGVISSVAGGGGTGSTITTNGTLITAGTAQAQPAATIAGVTTGSVAIWSLPNPPDATWQTGIAVILVCTANTVTPYLVNGTAASITPVAQVMNIGVLF